MGTNIDTTKPGYIIDKPIQIKEVASIAAKTSYGTLWFDSATKQFKVTLSDSTIVSISNGSVFTNDIARYGFTVRTETGLSFDGTNKLTLADKGSGWSYYRNGVKCTISGNKDVTVATPMVDGTLYYIFIDSLDGTLVSGAQWTLNDTKVPVATLYWKSTLTPKYLLCDERHTCLIDRQIHRYEHFSEGTKLLSGGTMSGLVAASDLDADKTFGITDTQIADEDIFLTITSLTDPEGLTAAYHNLYRTSPTAWVWATSDMPFKYASLGGGTYGYIEYDNGSGVSTQASNNQFVNTYVVVTNAVGNSEADQTKSTTGLRYFIVQGRGVFSSASLAAAENFGSFNLTGLPVNEAVAIYQITWATTNRPNTVKGRCRYVSTQKVTANIVTTSAVAIANHNTLSGIQGGTAGEYYHLTDAQHSTLVLQNVTRINVATYDLLSTDHVLHVDYTVTNPVTDIRLMSAQCIDGRRIEIKDTGCNSLSNNITVTTEGSEKIITTSLPGSDDYVFNVNGAFCIFTARNGNWYVS